MTVFGGLVPSIGSQPNTEFRVNSFQYGNGYEAIGPDGVNGDPDTFVANFDALNPAQVALLEAWLLTVRPWVLWAGDGVVLPSNRLWRITKDGIQRTALGAGSYSISFQVREAF